MHLSLRHSHTEQQTGYKFSSTNVYTGLLTYTGLTKSATMTYGQKLIRNQYRNRLKRNELALTFTTKKWQQHCQTSSAVDTTRTQKKRTTKEYLEKRSGVRIGDSRIQAQLEEDGSGGSRQN